MLSKLNIFVFQLKKKSLKTLRPETQHFYCTFLACSITLHQRKGLKKHQSMLTQVICCPIFSSVNFQQFEKSVVCVSFCISLFQMEAVEGMQRSLMRFMVCDELGVHKETLNL